MRALRLRCAATVQPPRPSPPPSSNGGPRPRAYNGTFSLILVNVLLYAADHGLRLPAVPQLLYLSHRHPHWWQLLSSAFCHASWDHLTGNLFLLLVFGKAVEEEGGALGVWLTYLVCAAGASAASLLLLPSASGGAQVVSLGASGAVFGLFAVSALSKLSLDWRKLLECGILGGFALERVTAEARLGVVAGGVGAGGVNHVAHLAGAAAGVLLCAALARVVAAAGAPRGDGGGLKR